MTAKDVYFETYHATENQLPGDISELL